MKDDGTSSMIGDSSSVQEQLTTIIGLLTKKAATEEALKPGILKNLQDSLFPEQKSERSSFRRLKQKQKTYQGIPIAIDSITPEGRRDIKRAFSNVISFEVDYEKPNVKSGPWAKFFFFLALLFGILVGAITQIIKDVRGLFRIIKTKFKNLFTFLGKTKIGQFITKLFNGIKSKFLNAIKFIKNNSIVKAISGFFTNIKNNLLNKFKKITDLASKLFKTISARVIAFFNTVKNIVVKIRNFFKPITAFLSKFTKIGSVIGKAGKMFQGFLGFFGKLSKFFGLGLKLGRLLGKALFPLFLLIDTVGGLFKSFNDPKLKDKSLFQKIITGLVAGIAKFFDIFEIFGLELFGFDEIRDRFDKIFTAFKGGIINGILEWFNQIQSYAIGLIGKVIGWIVGWFNKDAGKAITEWSKNFDLGKFIIETVGAVVKWFKKIFNFIGGIKDTVASAYGKIKEFATGLYDKIIGFVKNVVDAIANIFNIKKIKDWIKDKLGFGPTEKQVEIKSPTPVGDIVDTSDRTIFSKRGSYSLDKNDEILAMKKGGPIAEIMLNNTRGSLDALKNLNDTAKKINEAVDRFAKSANSMQDREIKLMQENLILLKDLKDKNNSSNVVVQNNSNSNVFSEKTSSNIDMRKDLALRSSFPF